MELAVVMLMLMAISQPGAERVVVDGNGALRTPPEADFKAVVAYAKSLPVDGPPVRFLSQYNIPPIERAEHVSNIVLVLNELSWAVPIAKVGVVPETDGRVLVFSPADLCAKPEDLKRWLDTWELLTRTDYVF